MFLTINQIEKRLGKPIKLAGWVFNVRSSGGILFLQLRDGTGTLQAVARKDKVSPQLWREASKLTIESSVILSGKVRKEKRAPGSLEMEVSGLEILQIARGYPISKKEHGPDFLLQNRHLWLRSEKQTAILKIRDAIVRALRDFMHQEGFVLADSPILTGSSVEGASTLFEMDYFKEGKAYLSQSGQLYQEAASSALGKTYTFGPTFRAEKSKTRRHLTEFWMLEPEASWMSFEENLALQEKLVIYTTGQVLKENKKELAVLGRDLQVLTKIKAPFEKIKYQEAIKRLQKMGVKIKEGDDIGADEEVKLTEKRFQPLFVTHFPAHLKAFYMEPDPKNPKTTLSTDLLAPQGYGEIIGGSQRISDLKTLEKRIKEFKLPKKNLEWYLDLRRYGSVPHGGFGLGLERLIAWLTGTHHIRETIPFPRTIYRIYP